MIMKDFHVATNSKSLKLIACIILSLSIIFFSKEVYAEYPGECIYERTSNLKWHFEVFPSIPRHYFPTEADPFTAVICRPIRSVSSIGKYSPGYLTCEKKTVTSGEYWGLYTSTGRSIQLYYFDGIKWILSDSFYLMPPCPPYSSYYCMSGIGSSMVFFSNEDKIYLDSIPTSLPSTCPNNPEPQLNLGEPQKKCP
jgi:hypothetical protein